MCCCSLANITSLYTLVFRKYNFGVDNWVSTSGGRLRPLLVQISSPRYGSYTFLDSIWYGSFKVWTWVTCYTGWVYFSETVFLGWVLLRWSDSAILLLEALATCLKMEKKALLWIWPGEQSTWIAVDVFPSAASERLWSSYCGQYSRFVRWVGYSFLDRLKETSLKNHQHIYSSVM